MLKKILPLSTMLLLIVGGTANSALIDNGNGLIYDTDLNITWYDNPNYDTHMFADYVTWANNLVVGNAENWRLPTTGGQHSGYTNEGEMGHLYYDELNNTPNSFVNAGPFQHLNAEYLGFYTSTYGENGNVHYYDLGSGSQSLAWTGNWYFWIHAIAVHDGNIGGGSPVPVPTTLLLLATGLTGLAAIGRRKDG